MADSRNPAGMVDEDSEDQGSDQFSGIADGNESQDTFTARRSPKIRREDFWPSMSRLLEPPPALKVWDWAQLRRWLSRGVTAKAGKYSVEFAPYQRKPQESFTDPEVQTTVLYWAKRLGKTEMVNNLHGSVIEQDPRNILHVMPTLDSVKKHRKQFFNPMRRSTPILKDLIKEIRTKDSENTMLSVGFPGGNFSMIGANSPTGFRQVQAPVVTCDEIDSMENMPEGDPVYAAFGRSENYSDCIQVVSSTATFLETSRIHAWYQRSDQQNWFCPCPKCAAFEVLKWHCVKWPKNRPEEAIYECPLCSGTWDDKMRIDSIRAGEWRATAPFDGIRGFWLNGLNSVFAAKKGFKSKMHQFAKDFLDAEESGESAMLYWKNTFLCEPEEVKVDSVNKAPLLARLEDYRPDSLPNNVIVIVCAVDVQADRLEYEIVGQGQSEETWGIEYGKLPGSPEREEVWRDLSKILSKKLKRQDGIELPITCACIDHRHKGNRVRQFIRNCGIPRVWPVYGVPGRHPVLVSQRFDKIHNMYFYAVCTDLAKDTIFARLKIAEPGPRFMHFPKGNGYEEENKYFEGLTSEEVRIKYNHGFPTRYYHKDPSRRNEPLDLRVYALAAVDILKPVVDSIAKKLLPSTGPEVQKAAEPHPIVRNLDRPPNFRMPSKGGFVNSWKK